jgi:hypothetical protein
MSVNGEQLIEPRRFVETCKLSGKAMLTYAPAYLCPLTQGIMLETPATAAK